MYPGTYAAVTPDKPALIMADTGETITYSELEQRSIRIAHYFRSLDLQRGDHLALISTNEAAIFDVYWAAMRTGLYVTAVNSHLTSSEVAYLIDDCQAKAVVFSSSLSPIATSDEVISMTPRVEHRLSFGGDIPGHTRLEGVMESMPITEPADQPRGADMLYSSGTTGRPKGIEPTLPDRQIQEPGDTMTALARAQWGFNQNTVYLSPAPLYHAAPLRSCASVHALGGTVVVMDRFDAEKALSYIERYGVTHSQWVPTMFVRMLKLPKEVRSRYDVASLQLAIHAAAPCPVDVKRSMIEWWGPILLEYYSSTELNGMTTVDTEQWLRKPSTVGRPILGVAHICDEDGQELPAGQIGTLYFERESLPFQYHNDPEKTRQAQHPDHPTWTTTGDVGYLDEDGFLFLTGRKSFMIISGGVNIYPQEIENCLTMHPDVLDIAVIGEPDPDWGESVLAVVQCKHSDIDFEETEKSLRAFAEQRLAGYKRPRRYRFVDTLPRTPTGKLLKHQIAPA